jgi:preprotein translocase subunit SecF
MNIVGKRFWYFLISGVLIVLGVVSLSTWGLKSSIEFSSGSMLTVKFEQSVGFDQFRQEIVKLGYGDSIIQSTGGGQYLIRTKVLTEDQKKQLESDLTTQFGTMSEAEFNSVSPLVASETARNAAIAVGIALVGILIYVTIAFRKMHNAFRLGACSVLALFHDVLVTTGLFSFFGHFFGWELNLMFITGILTIIGYSINNTIVVFDRIRENSIRGISTNFEFTVNRSVTETIGRSFNTSITVMITNLALMVFVGATIQSFAVTLFIGNIVGTFDSVFVAPSLLVVWDNNEWGRFVGMKPKLATAKGK